MIVCPNCKAQNRDTALFCRQCGARLILGGEYHVVKVIKPGGMGTVYKAESEGKLYAVKEMRDTFTNPKDRQDAINRFMAEALILARLSHPHIPKVHRHFIENDRYYLVMDFIEGEDLGAVLDRQKGKRLPEEQVLSWALQLCAVLEYLHGQTPPVIFRDLKPANIMLRPNRDISLIDFGIAKLFNPVRQGTLIGTPGYAAPEQYQGLAEPRSDIFALGATLHHLLIGRDPQQHPPFNFPPATALNPAITPGMEAVLQKALRMNLEERWGSIREIRQALMSQGEPIKLEPGAVLDERCQTAGEVPARRVLLIPTLSRDNVLVTDQPQRLHVLLEIIPTEMLADVQMPLNFGLVVDTSSSMYGERIQQVKEAIKHVIDLLDDDDYISVIVFSDSTRTLVSSQQAHSLLNREALKREVDKLSAGGGIVMAPAMRAGLAEIKKHWSPHRINRLVLLCSGQTEGELNCLKEAGSAARNNVPIIALGVGTDWNEDLLMEIGFKSGGQADYIDQAHDISQHFESTMQAMQSAVVQNAVLTLHLVDGVIPLGYSLTSDQTITVFLGELEKDRGQTLLMELMLPVWQAGTYRIAQAEVVYDVPQLNLISEKVQADIMLRFTHDPNLARLVNSRVINVVEKVMALKV
jgi:serine/threonine protein kinase